MNSGSASADYASGSRLRARVFVVNGRSRLFDTWHDTLFDQDCAFSTASDGKLRCLPTTKGTPYFADAACTQPLLLFTTGAACAALPTMIFVSPNASCDGPTFYTLGAKLAGLPDALYEQNELGCTARVADSSVEYYPTSVVDAGRFVAADIESEARGTRLGVRVLHAEDGAIQTRDVFDEIGKFTCSPALATEDTPASCKPLELAFKPDLFADASCTVPIAIELASLGYGCEGPPKAVQGTITESCYNNSATPPLFDVGDEFKGRPYESFGLGQCFPYIASNLTDSYWYVGAAYRNDFASFGVRDEGSDRVKVRAMISPSGERLRAAVFFDSARNATCEVAAAGDGQLRCLPRFTATGEALTFLDAQCTSPLLWVTAGCNPGSIVSSSSFDPNTCSRLERWYEIGAQVNPAVSYEAFNGGCVPGGFGGVNPINSVYATAAELAPSSFVSATIEIE